MKQLALVFLGGGTGSIMRFLLGKWLNNFSTGIPYGTFLANVLGSLLIGLILGYFAKSEHLSQETTLLLATGFCGGFTTFSTFAYESHMFLRSGDFITFAAYGLTSVIIGFAAVFLGMWLVKFI
ncbi:fluoride efflux transporter CrcB [Mesonia aestuariivivens]|uniref:Fluoride-specific ion channel FluC n=1 Tax=Mesonia aestuariivivens TaxID=2796128 RepID=A0ABS6W1K8_9FLAO|nr:fluoride efflux transporter CrcB [Mesonia aestuariivivens]MBW2961004.1 fluoride efflux transporter CrcB [Mesonia aestuariivivens]